MATTADGRRGMTSFPRTRRTMVTWRKTWRKLRDQRLLCRYPRRRHGAVHCRVPHLPRVETVTTVAAAEASTDAARVRVRIRGPRQGTDPLHARASDLGRGRGRGRGRQASIEDRAGRGAQEGESGIGAGIGEGVGDQNPGIGRGMTGIGIESGKAAEFMCVVVVVIRTNASVEIASSIDCEILLLTLLGFIVENDFFGIMDIWEINLFCSVFFN